MTCNPTLHPDAIKNLKGLDAETRDKIKEGLGVLEYEPYYSNPVRNV